MKKLLSFIFLTLIFSLTSINAFKILNLTYTNVSFSYATEESFAIGAEFSSDGLNYYITGASDFIHQYSLTTAYDITTATLIGEFDVDPFMFAFPSTLEFNDNGTKLFVLDRLGPANNQLKEFTLSNPWDITSAVFANEYKLKATNESRDFDFSNDGLYIYLLDSAYFVNLMSLSNPYDLSSISEVGGFDFGTLTNDIPGTYPDIAVNDTNEELYIISQSTNKLHVFSSATPYVINSYSLDTSYFLGNEGSVFTSMEFDDTGELLFTTDNSDDTVKVWNTGFSSEPPTYTVDITTNYAPYTNFIYEDDDISIETSNISRTILNDEPWSVTSNIINISPFTFNEWINLDTLSTFSSNRTFTVNDPNRNYDLIGDYTLDQSINLSFDSTLPSPPQFNLFVETLEGSTGTITQYPFNNHEHPLDFDWEITAPTSGIGFYEFNYWYDNNNQEIYSINSNITGSGINNKDLTATYSLPEEYQIDLQLSTNIGFITFQLGNLDPITGTTINTTVSSGDDWTATAPSGGNDFIFTEWADTFTLDTFSNSEELNVNNTENDYFLTAQYDPIYQVNWDSNGGTLIPSQFIKIGDFVNAPNNPIRPNFVFAGWYEEGDVNQIEVNFPYQIIDDITFGAIWLDTYTIDYYPNGGAPVDSETLIAGQTPTVVTPSRFGYTFEGWYTDNVTFNNAFNFNTPVNQNEDVYAKWAFGTEDNAEQSLNVFLVDSNLDDPFAQIIIVLAFFVLLNAIIYVYSGPMIVTLILNFILTALFMVLGFIPFWIIIMIFIAIFGFALLMLFGGRSTA